MRFLVAIIILWVAVVSCQPGAKLGDLSKVAEAERDVAQNNWERVEKAFKAGDDRTLEGLVGCKVLVLVDASGRIIKGGGAPYGHIAISGPGERADIYNLQDTLPGSPEGAVPAICVAESTGANDPAEGKNGLTRSFYAYVDAGSHPGVMRFHRGFNGKTISMRVKGAAWGA